MTVSVFDITSGPYMGNDVADSFSYDFTVKLARQLIVYETDLDGVVTPLTLDSDYAVNDVGNEGGGTIDRIAGALPTGYVWFIVSDYLLTQSTDFESQGGFFPDVHESAFDKLTYLTLQLQRAVDLSLSLPPSYSGNASTELPLPDADKYLRWNSTATALMNVAGTVFDAGALGANIKTDYGAKGDAVYQYEVDGSVTVTSGTDDTQTFLDAMADVAAGNITRVDVPAGVYWVDLDQIDTPSFTSIVGAGSNSTTFVMSTTNPNTNLFVGFYQGERVRNLSFRGFKIIGSKVDDNSIGGTGIFTFGTDGVIIDDVHSEGCKGLAWLGNDAVEGMKLYGTRNAYLSRLRVDDCKLFAIYIRGNEDPNVLALPENDTHNITVDGLTIRGSNVGFVIAEGLPFDIRLSNYDCQDTDNLLQIESCRDVYINDSIWKGATSQWNALSPAPFKLQWQIAGSSNVYFNNCYIDSELQSFGFPLNNRPCKNINFSNIDTGGVTRFSTLLVQDGEDTNKNMFAGWKFENCHFPRDSNTFFQSSPLVNRPRGYWRDWSFSGCTWENDSSSSPFNDARFSGSLVFDDKCVFNGKPPRVLYGQNITFDAYVRTSVPESSIQFSAIDGTEPTEQKVLRIGGNIQIEGEVKDVGFDITHDNGSYDARNQSPQCRTSNATEFKDSGTSFYRFTGANGFVSDGIGEYKSLVTFTPPSVAGENTFITEATGNGSSLSIVNGADAVTNNSLVIVKRTDIGSAWGWFDTIRGATKYLSSNSSGIEVTEVGSLTSFNNDGFTLGSSGNFNSSGQPVITYQMLEAEGFLDIIEEEGTAAVKTIAHSLGTDVGCIIAKNSNAGTDWPVYYHTFDIALGGNIALNDNLGVVNDLTIWDGTEATSTEFTVGTSALSNGNLQDIIYYVFAQNVCHSYSGNGLTTNVVDFGYKPKMIIINRATAGTFSEWALFDNIRDNSLEFETGLQPSVSNAEFTEAGAITLTDTGIIINTTAGNLNAAGSSYILIAIPEI